MVLSPGSHGVIVIHGIGDNMKRGDLLADLTNSLADALMESRSHGKDPKIRRDVNLDGTPPSVTLNITSPTGEKAIWVGKEAFWDDAFPAPKAANVLWWLLKQNLRNQIKFIFEGITKDPANDGFINQKDMKYERKRHPGQRLWTAKKYQKVSCSKLSFKSLLLSLGLFLLVPFTYLGLFFVWLCHYLPSVGPLESILKLIRKLDPFLSNSLGDVEKYIEHGVWSGNARARLENIVIAMLNDQYGEVKDITIIAHSMGCVVTYDTLAEGGRVAEEVKRLEVLGKGKKISFVSVGSGINQVFRLARKSSSYAQEQFKRPLAKEITGYEEGGKKQNQTLEDKFFWLDICARRDPVPAGNMTDDIVKQARIDPEQQIKRRRVICTDNIMFDHMSYWANKDIVIPRIARAINGGTEYPWPEAGITRQKIINRLKLAARFGWITNTAILVILGVCAIVVLKLAGVI
ncbi:MAG: hypothetical protein PHG35_08215 [Dehalococcoidales bacterium]|nr:hypothetical protein [Dehalococcoidales bacterium]